MTPRDFAPYAERRRTAELRHTRELAEAMERAKRLRLALTVQGNARITITPAGKRSRTPAANTLRKLAA
jgi:hypothetical protein